MRTFWTVWNHVSRNFFLLLKYEEGNQIWPGACYDQGKLFSFTEMTSELSLYPSSYLFFFLFVLCVGAYEGSGQVRVGPTDCVQRKKFKRLVTCTCIILPVPNSPIFCLCLDQKLMWTSYFCVASNLELHLALCVSCLTGLSPQIEPKILGWFLSRQPHPYLEGMLWLPAKAVLWKTHYSFSEVVFTG